MIFISSSCVKARTIKESIEKIHSWGYKNIELSGGTQLYSGITEDLLELKEKYQLNYLCHNYFPPPAQNFVLNLASLNTDIHTKSVNHVKNAILLSGLLGATKYAVHAGFLIDIPVQEIGKSINVAKQFNKTEAKEKFVETLHLLTDFAAQNKINLYIENNVVSAINFENFSKSNPFFLCDKEDALEFKKLLPAFKVLLDMAHLRVSCKTLGLNFEEQAHFFISNTDYIHISDNNGLSDTNNTLNSEGEIYSLLKKNNIKNKIITLEVYSSEGDIRSSYELISNLL